MTRPSLDTELLAARNEIRREIFAIPNVTGIGLGGRERNGEPTGEPCLKVFVNRKLPAGQLSSDELVPPGFGDIRIDVVAVPSPEPAALLTPVPGVPTDEVKKRHYDRTRHPVLKGGISIASARGRYEGTLGCLLRDKNDPEAIYALTNWHVMAKRINETTYRDPEVGDRVGHPHARQTCFGLSSRLIGHYEEGDYDDAKPFRSDQALVRLNPGTQYSPEIDGLCVIEGIRPQELTVGEVLNQEVYLFKKGIRTGVTGGIAICINYQPKQGYGTVLQHDDGSYDLYFNDIVIRPNPHPEDPNRAMTFVDHGDSGSVIVDQKSQVVGLLWGAVDPDSAIAHDGHPGEAGDGFAIPIHDLIGELNGSDRDLEIVAREDGVEYPLTVPEPSGTTNIYSFPRTDRDERLPQLWDRHADEVMHLINSNRRVATAWHRSGSSALFQHLLRMAADPERTLPDTINGRTIDDCIKPFLLAVRRHGSAALVNDLEELTGMVTDAGGKTFAQFLDTLVVAS